MNLHPFGQKRIISNRRLLISGNVLEVYHYEKPIIRGEERKRIGRAGQWDTTEEAKAGNRQKTAQRAKRRVCHLANTNFSGKLAKFITLTYAANQISIRIADHDYKTFIQRLSYYLRIKIEYIAVREFQERGAVHYHMLCNIPYIPNAELREIWGHGFVNIQSVEEVDNVGAYITKYMTKDVEDERLLGKKKYLCSKNLAEPIEVIREEVMDDIFSEMGNVKRVNDPVEYETDYYGVIRYQQIILEEAPDRDRLQAIIRAARERGYTGKGVSPNPRGALAQPRGVAAERKQLSLC